jgi:hypothetical protein
MQGLNYQLCKLKQKHQVKNLADFHQVNSDI